MPGVVPGAALVAASADRLPESDLLIEIAFGTHPGRITRCKPVKFQGRFWSFRDGQTA
jgi:hypothetical protein